MSRAHRNGNGVRISARKSWVTSAGQAHSYVVSALAPKGRGPPIRLSYLLPAQTRGLAVAGPWDRKNARKPGGGVRRDTFSACRQALRNYGDFSAILAVIQLDFLQPRLYGGENGMLRILDKHRAILLFFYEFQLRIVLPSKLADSMRRILPEMVASGGHRYH
jgi:hypothetical protein